MRRDLIGLPMRVDNHVAHPGLGQPVERVIEQCALSEFQQRLGRMFRERPHTQAMAGGQQDSVSDFVMPPFRAPRGEDASNRRRFRQWVAMHAAAR